MIPMSAAEIGKRFGDAGIIASRILESPWSLAEVTRAAARRAHRLGYQTVACSGLFLWTASTWHDKPTSIAAFVPALTLTLLLNRLLAYVGALQQVELLRPCDLHATSATAPDEITLAPAAKQWLEFVRISGRGLRRFDLEIMSMLEEHEHLKLLGKA